MAEFNIGDIVKVPSYSKSERRVITAVKSSGLYRTAELRADGTTGTHFTSARPAEDLVLVESAEQRNRLKIGDRVLVTLYPNRAWAESWETTIVNISPSGAYKFEKWRSGEAGLHHWKEDSGLTIKKLENNMEVTRENLNKHTIYVANKQSIFPVGTEVRLAEDDGSDCPRFESLEEGRQHYDYISSFYVFGHEPKEEVTEVTLEEVAQKMGIKVENLRIKE